MFLIKRRVYIYILFWMNQIPVVKIHRCLDLSVSVKWRFFRVCFLYNTFSNSFDGEKPDFHFTLVLTKVLTKDLYWKMFCVCQMTLEPSFWGCCFFKTHTGTAFDSEQLEFHLRVGLNQRSVVKIHLFGFHKVMNC